ncbi:MAG: response regulator transcription factor [Deltaproteobacteria bacterium]|nr:response regulator transcription factor [Deltaproteobacteria bacterium]
MNERILLVEDDGAIMETLAMFLQYEGYEVLRARNVERALEVLEHATPQLVLLDYMLQDDTAEPVIAALRAKHGDCVRVILLTAADDPVGKARDSGADSVVAKPFELEVLLRAICDTLAGACSKELQWGF